jgi:hypothetical protein
MLETSNRQNGINIDNLIKECWILTLVINMTLLIRTKKFCSSILATARQYRAKGKTSSISLLWSELLTRNDRETARGKKQHVSACIEKEPIKKLFNRRNRHFRTFWKSRFY